jgi:hypothetical protein
MKPKSHIIVAILITLFAIHSVFSQQKSIEISGKLVDANQMGIPYVAISIPSKSIGTSANEEGYFSLSLSTESVLETMEISSIGFKTVKIKIQDFINRKNKTIILEDDVATLDEVLLTAPSFFVKNALKNLKHTTVSDPHQLNILYRRVSTEDHKARFFVEHYAKVIDRGPGTYGFDKIQIVEGRKSADYRFIKQKQNNHALQIMTGCNQLRMGIALKKYEWTKVGGTTYDGEDIIVVEGKQGKWDYLRLYIGMETYGVYKIENSSLNSVYIYKKNTDGKLYLSYHNREWKSKKNLTPEQKMLLGNKVSKIDLSYRHEMFVLGIETDKKKMKVKNYGGYGTDIGDLQVAYHRNFWDNFSSPPPTNFHKKNIREIESIYGVPIQIQFNAVNK